MYIQFNTRFLGPTRVPPNGNSIGSSVLEWLIVVMRPTDKQTDEQTQTDHATLSVAIGRICETYAIRVLRGNCPVSCNGRICSLFAGKGVRVSGLATSVCLCCDCPLLR